MKFNNQQEIARDIVSLANRKASNSNFQVNGFNQYILQNIVESAIEVLAEKGLLSGCLLCRNNEKDKE